jgi:hypothetical protein
MPRNEYSHATASKIRACLKANPGLRAKDIAKLVGLRRETVNSYLYPTFRTSKCIIQEI